MNLNRMFESKTAMQWILDAFRRPKPKELWMSFWYENEVCCLFADTNVGKSIYAVQIANEISKRQKVLYFDFEMSDKQFQMRYTDDDAGELFQFNENFIRLEFSRAYGNCADLQTIIDQIAYEVIQHDAKVVIIDNITWICNRCESGDAAGELMQLLINLKRAHGLSILVLAHTPKRNVSSPLTQNSLAGSKRIANFMDSMFAIGMTANNKPYGRYIKQIKVRSSEMMYGDNNVITADLAKQGSFLMLAHNGFAKEYEVLDEDDGGDTNRSINRQIEDLLRDGMAVRQISKKLSVSTRRICQVSKQMDK